MTYHFLTQPLPSWVARYMHKLPRYLLQVNEPFYFPSLITVPDHLQPLFTVTHSSPISSIFSPSPPTLPLPSLLSPLFPFSSPHPPSSPSLPLTPPLYLGHDYRYPSGRINRTHPRLGPLPPVRLQHQHKG